MAEYIERKRASAILGMFYRSPHAQRNTQFSAGMRYATDTCIKIINNEVPTADVVEVVRCKNCIYFEKDEEDALGLCKCGNIATNYGGEIYPTEEHFCSYGEKKK